MEQVIYCCIDKRRYDNKQDRFHEPASVCRDKCVDVCSGLTEQRLYRIQNALFEVQNMLDLMHDIMPVDPGKLRGATAIATKIAGNRGIASCTIHCVMGTGESST